MAHPRFGECAYVSGLALVSFSDSAPEVPPTFNLIPSLLQVAGVIGKIAKDRCNVARISGMWEAPQVPNPVFEA